LKGIVYILPFPNWRMDGLTKNSVLNALGVVFLAFAALAFFNAIFIINDVEHLFWISYMMLLLMGVSLVTKNSYLLAACLNIIVVPYFLWTFDFFYILVVGESVLNIADYFFWPGPLISKIVSAQHLFSFVLGIYALSIMRLKRKDSWKLSFAILTIMFVLSVALTSPPNNINCVYESCIGISVPQGMHILVWFASLFTIAFLTNFLWRAKYFRKN
jgi:hypothetical protein